MPYRHRNYEAFQFIAYEAPTNELTAAGDDPGVEHDPLGQPDSVGRLPDDERTRVRRLWLVAQQALELADRAGGRSKAMLKILVAPEFYFRPTNPGDTSQPYNSYTERAANGIFDNLVQLFRHPRFEDWLIVAGTTVWNRPAEWSDSIAVAPRDPTDLHGERYAYYNTTLVMKGGSAEAPSWICHKARMAALDKVPMERASGLHPMLGEILGRWESRRRCVFEVDHLRFGIEICLDHRSGVLRDVLAEGIRQRVWEREDVDIHLLPCCWMGLQPQNCAARPGGYFLRVDGQSNAYEVQSFNSSMHLVPRELADVKEPAAGSSSAADSSSAAGSLASMRETKAFAQMIRSDKYRLLGSSPHCEHQKLEGPLLIPMPASAVEHEQRLVAYPPQSTRW